MRNYKTYLSLLAIHLLMVNVYCQKVKTIRLEVEKEIPGEPFSDNKFEIDFWVQAENFSSINLSKTTLLLLKDDTEKDLFKAHKQAVAAYDEESKRLAKGGHYRFSSSTESLFKPEDWEPMRDTLGFKATIKSGMARPANKATKVHVKMNISYYVKSLNKSSDSISVSIPSLYNSPSFMFQGKKITLSGAGSISNDKGKFIIYRIPKNDFPVSLNKVKVLNDSGTPLERISGGIGTYEFMVKEGRDKKPVNLVINYVPISEKNLILDKWLTLGLNN